MLENPSRSAVSEILRPARLVPTTMPHSKSLKASFFLSDAQFELQQIVLTMSTCLRGRLHNTISITFYEFGPFIYTTMAFGVLKMQHFENWFQSSSLCNVAQT